MIPEFEKNFPLVCRACRDEPIDMQHIEVGSIFTPLYQFEYISIPGH